LNGARLFQAEAELAQDAQRVDPVVLRSTLLELGRALASAKSRQRTTARQRRRLAVEKASQRGRAPTG